MTRTEPIGILVVDDDPAVLDLLREMLEEEGYAVTAASAPPPTAEVARLHPDLIVLDHRLRAAESGWDVIRRLGTDPATAAVPILLCTAATGDVRCLADQLTTRGVEVVLKPFDLDDLLAAVRRALARAPGPPRWGACRGRASSQG
jgi:CheY-like chemotaxis protein